MGAPTAVLVSYRFGGRDGVSEEARKWEGALGKLGFATRRVAGEFEDGLAPADRYVQGLGRLPIPGCPADAHAVAASIDGADLVVVENLCSLPVNLDAARATAAALTDFSGRVVFHHHDLPWEREGYAADGEFPPQRAQSLHVTISDQARRALEARGFEAATIRNAFDPHPREGARAQTRYDLQFDDSDVVVLQPTRAIPRKEVGRGLRFAEQLAGRLPDRRVRYWLTGPAEDGFGPALATLLDATSLETTHRAVPDIADAYAASDLVVMPSRWEGFGNPVVEAMLARRPVVAAPYPVLNELLGLGLEVLPLDDPTAAARALLNAGSEVVDENQRVAAATLSIADLPGRIEQAFTRVGWVDW